MPDFNLIKTRDLPSRLVRVIVLDPQHPKSMAEKPAGWADSHKAPNYAVDDSRECIYSGTADNPR